MNKVIVIIFVIIFALSAIQLVSCTNVDESYVSEPSETSAEADASADTSEASKDPSEGSDASANPSDEPSDEVSKEQGDEPSAPDEVSKEETSQPNEVSKPEEEASKNEESSKAEDTKPTHTHTWAKATCTAPKTCKGCGETEGKANDHDWASATCMAPQTCKTCGQTAGGVTAHSYENGKCKHCGDEKEVVTGDTPVDIVINGKQESVDSYEEAVKVLTLKDLEDMAAGEKIDVVYNGATLKFTANGDGTFVDAVTGRSCNAQRVYNFYISQFCSHCGKRVGHGDNGTCTYFLHDTNCPYCGEFCKAQECHTCDE